RLRGSSGTLGMVQVKTLCQDLEQRAQARRLDGSHELVAGIASALATGLAELAAHPAMTAD
ncbi:MAG: Hpt domain-containing protein, partial [Planctomycetes bacterium]|nr:Hpt domain-containing protein [Planctomycetota bacterium]